jgi:hypothetical protein
MVYPLGLWSIQRARTIAWLGVSPGRLPNGLLVALVRVILELHIMHIVKLNAMAATFLAASAVAPQFTVAADL